MPAGRESPATRTLGVGVGVFLQSLSAASTTSARRLVARLLGFAAGERRRSLATCGCEAATFGEVVALTAQRAIL